MYMHWQRLYCRYKWMNVRSENTKKIKWTQDANIQMLRFKLKKKYSLQIIIINKKNWNYKIDKYKKFRRQLMCILKKLCWFMVRLMWRTKSCTCQEYWNIINSYWNKPKKGFWVQYSSAVQNSSFVMYISTSILINEFSNVIKSLFLKRFYDSIYNIRFTAHRDFLQFQQLETPS